MDKDHKIARIRILRERIESGIHVPNPELRRVLSVKQMNEILVRYEKLRSNQDKVPVGLRKYQQLYRSAAQKNRLNNLRIKDTLKRRQRAKDADTAVEKAFEAIREVLETDPSLVRWLDKDPRGHESLDFESLAKVTAPKDGLLGTLKQTLKHEVLGEELNRLTGASTLTARHVEEIRGQIRKINSGLDRSKLKSLTTK